MHKKKIVVFDFDKTLTHDDTLLGFYRISSEKNFSFFFKLVIYFFFVVANKISIISNDTFKKWGVILFLRGLKETEITNQSYEYSHQINYNKLYHDYKYNFIDNEYYIITASFEVYVGKCFPEEINVIGSTLEYYNDKVSNLKYNCYGQKKLQFLRKIGIDHIDEFYTDSFSDLSLAEISDKIYIVNGNSIHNCNCITEFIKYFQK